MILQRAKDYDHYNKDELRERARNKYGELSEKEKRQHEKKNTIPKKTDTTICLIKKKKELKEYQRNYRESKRNKNIKNY